MVQPDASPQSSSSPGDQKGARKPVEIGDTFEAKRFDTPLDKMTRERAGRARTRAPSASADATSRRSPPKTVSTTSPSTPPYARRRPTKSAAARRTNDLALQLRRSDLQRRCVRRTGNLILFVVDASWSMAASERMEATKGAIFSLLVDAYQRRDQVGLVVFQRDRARLVCRPPIASTWRSAPCRTCP